MPKTITRHPVAECGCQATSWYAWSDDGLHDDGDTVVDECAWHWAKQAAFNTWLQDRNGRMDDATSTEEVLAIQAEEFDEVFWLQVIDREDEAEEFTWEHAWRQQARNGYNVAIHGEPPF